MALPAARKTDDTSHLPGSEITVPCAAHTEIEGLPAARITDTNACLLHVPNPIVWGSETVVIEGRWASRKTDQSVCEGEITTGAESVEIGGPTLKFKAKNGLFPGSQLGNTLVAISTETHNIYILAYLEYSGPNASPEYAAYSEAQIEAMWGGRTTTIDGETYTVNVDVTTRVRDSNDPATPGYDQIWVDDSTSRPNQAPYGMWSGYQTSNMDPNSYVPAHEFAHSLGLWDEYHDTYDWQWEWPPVKFAGSVPNDPSKVNNIMSQTWPDDAGVPPHPYDDQYEQILKNYGLR